MATVEEACNFLISQRSRGENENVETARANGLLLLCTVVRKCLRDTGSATNANFSWVKACRFQLLQIETFQLKSTVLANRKVSISFFLRGASAPPKFYP